MARTESRTKVTIWTNEGFASSVGWRSGSTGCSIASPQSRSVASWPSRSADGLDMPRMTHPKTYTGRSVSSRAPDSLSSIGTPRKCSYGRSCATTVSGGVRRLEEQHGTSPNRSCPVPSGTLLQLRCTVSKPRIRPRRVGNPMGYQIPKTMRYPIGTGIGLGRTRTRSPVSSLQSPVTGHQ